MDDRSLDILIALSWLGIATKEQLRQLCCPDVSMKTLERCLSGLESHNPPLIVSRKRASRTSEGTRRQPTVYLLAEEARTLLLQRDDYPRRTANGQYPIKAGGARADHLVDHDLQVVEAVISLVVAARQQDLSGVFLARELRIGTNAGTLIPDAVLLLQFGGVSSERAVPWTKVPSVGALVHAYAIESDRATEPHSTIAGKARLYIELQRLDDRQRWQERFRCELPIPFWIANTLPRAEAITNIWLQTWPQGTWLVTTPEQGAEGKGTQVFQGAVQSVGFYTFPVSTAAEETKPRVRPPAPTTAAPSPSSLPRTSSASPQAGTSPPAGPNPVPAPVKPTAAPQGTPPRPQGAPTPPAPSTGQEPRRRILPDTPPHQSHPRTAVPMAKEGVRPKTALRPDPLPTFPQWLVPRRYRDAPINILCCLGLVLWLPFWAAMTFVEHTLYGYVDIDELLVKRLGRLRTSLVWLCVIALIVSVNWIAYSIGRLRVAEAEARLPRAWVVYGPSPTPEPTATVVPATPACQPAVVTANRVNLRLAPGLDPELVLRKLNAGDRLEVCGDPIEVDDHRWRLVHTADGGSGYVSDLYLDLAP